MNKAEKRLYEAVRSEDPSAIRDAFKDMYLSYRPLVLYVLFREFGDDGWVEDDVDDAFIYAFDHLKDIVGKGSLKRYLIKTARSITLARKKKQQNKHLLSFEEDKFGEEQTPLAKETGFDHILQLAKSKLTNEQYKILIERICYKRKFRSLAKEMGLTEDSVRRRYKKALEIIRMELKDER